MISGEIKESVVLPGKISDRFFDRSDWNSLVDSCFALKTRVFAGKILNEEIYFPFQEDDNFLYGNYIGYGGPLCPRVLKESELLEVLRVIESLTNKRFKRVKLYPFGGVSDLDSGALQARTTSLCDLRKPASYARGTQYEIRKADRHGVEARPLATTRELDAFYRIYLETAQRVGSSYITPKDLFSGVMKLPGCFIMGGFLGDLLISGSVFLSEGQYAYYWWNAAGTAAREHSANYLVMDEALRVLRQKNLSFLDMASSHNQAIKRSKSIWGASDATYLEYLN